MFAGGFPGMSATHFGVVELLLRQVQDGKTARLVHEGLSGVMVPFGKQFGDAGVVLLL